MVGPERQLPPLAESTVEAAERVIAGLLRLKRPEIHPGDFVGLDAEGNAVPLAQNVSQQPIGHVASVGADGTVVVITDNTPFQQRYVHLPLG